MEQLKDFSEPVQFIIIIGACAIAVAAIITFGKIFTEIIKNN